MPTKNITTKTEEVIKDSPTVKIPKTKKSERVSASTSTKNSKPMAKLVDIAGNFLSDFELPVSIFDATQNKALLAQYIRVYLANQRAGTRDTKTRSEVKYSTRKIYRQKGTGRARHGSKRAPIFVGGGITFGPHQNDFSLSMNKKEIRQALLCALSQKASDSNIFIIDNVETTSKTKQIADFLKNLKINQNRTMFASSTPETAMRKASRNLTGVVSIMSVNLNPYEVLRSRNLIFTKDSLQELTSQISSKQLQNTKVDKLSKEAVTV